MDRNFLKRVKLFKSLDDSELDALIPHLKLRKYAKHHLVISEGAISNSLYLIVNGQVKVFLSDEDGKEVILAVMEAGDYFGEIGLLDDRPRTANITTLKDCQLAVMGKQDFLNCMRAHPEVVLSILKTMLGYIRLLDENVKSLALMDVYGRVARVLLNMAEEKDGERIITRKITLTELADWVGASTKMVSRIMKELKSGGYIVQKDDHLLVREELSPDD